MEGLKLSSKLFFYVNGVQIEDANPDPACTLLQYLREKLGLCGSKLGCGEGGCGACTVMLSSLDRSAGNIIHWSVTACLTPVCSVHGLAVTTIEGIGSTADNMTKLHPIQAKLALNHGSQCGFCTPGFIMSLYTMLRNNKKATLEDIETSVQGNLCRCTGYRPILESFYSFSDEWAKGTRSGGIGCCGENQELCCKPSCGMDRFKDLKHNPEQEPIFPPALMIIPECESQELLFSSNETTWYGPLKLETLLEYKSTYPDAKLVAGNTEIGVEMKFKNRQYKHLVHVRHIPELRGIREDRTGVEIGAAVTLTELGSYLKKLTESRPEPLIRFYSGILSMLHWFAGPAIRNMGSLGGNIMTGSPISDMIPLLMSAGAALNLIAKGGVTRTVPLDDTFFAGYRRNIVKENEVLRSVHIPFSTQFDYFQSYKQSRRKEDDISIVNAGMRVTFYPQTDVVKDFIIVYGGMGPTPRTASAAALCARNKNWNRNLFETVKEKLLDEFHLPDDAPGGMINYRKTLTLSFFTKFFGYVYSQLAKAGWNTSLLDDFNEETYHPETKSPINSTQVFSLVPSSQAKYDPIGRPIVHHSAFQQVTGEAVFCDDLPKWEKEMYLVPVLSTKAHAMIVEVDYSVALKVSGVKAVFTAADLTPEQNTIGHIDFDEEIFASTKVTCVGQIIAAVVANSREIAQRAAKLVRIVYEDMKPILTIEEAIEADSMYQQHTKFLECGNFPLALKQSDVVVEGEVRIGGQEHFYLEPQAAIAIPRREHDEIEIVSATQDPSGTQKLVAKALGIPANRVVVRVKRIGGGFGGKETRSACVSVPVAIAAARLQLPVRCSLDRDEDMLITGGRHPYLVRYQVGASSEGLIKAVKMDFYSNAGFSADLSPAILRTSLFHATNAYTIENCYVKGYCCKTNLPSNTAFRCFGRPQAIFAAESWMDHLSAVLNIPVHKLRGRNLHKEGECTIFGQKLENCTVRECWKQLMKEACYEERQAEIHRFNNLSKFRKRGISAMPAIFGVGFGPLYMNQASATIFVYTDGSVLINHCGMEMGQGLHTKIIQIASRALQIPTDRIHVQETATDKIPNGSATAASSGSDLNGAAVLEACKILKDRLRPYEEADPNSGWDSWVHAAYMDRVPLIATGFYKVQDVHLDFSTNRGNPYNYFTYGAACSEVKIDCLTGDHTVLRTDIVMDVGESLNPAIDIGQIEGAFIQGYGLFTLEELQYDSQGSLLTRGPGTYKIPAAGDIPRTFNVSLLRGSSNPRAVYSSKAIGEPPLSLAASVFFAIKEAVGAARKDNGLNGFFRFDSPASAERIRMACCDDLSQNVTGRGLHKENLEGDLK